MFKKIRNEPLAILALVLMLGVAVIAAKPGGMTGLTSLWVGDQTVTADVTPGANDVMITGTLEVDGATRFDGAIDANSTLNVSGAVTFGTVGTISSTEITDTTREIYLPIAGWAIDGAANVLTNTNPNLESVGNIPGIVWDNSGETAAIQQTFRLPSTYVDGLTIYCLVSSDGDIGTAGILDWRIWVNTAGSVFDSTAIEQTEVAMLATASPDSKNVVLTLELDATGENALTAGDFVTVDLFNATTHADGNLELIGTHGTYTSTQ